jgi:hypothetical protein
MQRIVFLRALLVIAAMLVAACASTTLKDSWSDPSYTGGTFKKWFVIGIGGNAVARRTLEDVMVAKLRARGVEAVPSYQFLPDGQAGEQQLDGAVAVSGADGLMMVRLRGVQTRTQVTNAYVPGPMMGVGWYGMYSGFYAIPEVNQYQIATVETSVFQVYQKKLVWTGITETFDPTSIAQEAPGFADVILGSLQQRGVVPPAK